MPTLICRHIKTNGVRCGTPALGGQVFCYFHNNVVRRHQSLSPFHDEPAILHPISPYDRDQAQRQPIIAEYFGLHPKRGPVELDFPPLEDRESIQLALSMVICALAQNRIDAKRATPLIYALQVASANAKDLNHSPSRSQLVTETVPTPQGLEIALDEESTAEISHRTFQEEFAAQEAAREDSDGEEDDDEDEDDSDDDEGEEDQDTDDDSPAERYLRRSLIEAL